MKTPMQKLIPFAHTAHNRCFGCGPANPTGMHLEFMLAEDRTVVCLASIPDTFEGPRDYLHGGIIATLLDEAMSKAVRSHNLVAMTRHMEVDYRRPVPSRTPIRIEGRVYHHEGRKHWADASICDEAGAVLAHGKGLFVEVREHDGRVAAGDESTPHA